MQNLSQFSHNSGESANTLQQLRSDEEKLPDIDPTLFPMPGTPEDEAMLREYEKRSKYETTVREAQQTIAKARLDAGVISFAAPVPIHEGDTAELEVELRAIFGVAKDEVSVEKLLYSLFDRVKDWMNYTLFQRFVKAVRRDKSKFRYKKELQVINQISCPIDKAERISQTAQSYGIPVWQVEKNLTDIKRQQSTPETKVYDLAEFFNQTSEALEWLIPELLPKGEMVLLVGAPKDGKTLLSIDAAFCAATGEDTFLGHRLGNPMKVLIISVDESAQSTKAKLLKRGFRASDAKNVRVMSSWDISQMQKLEAQLENFRPDLVIVDSLKRINCGREISENSAEFADSIYLLKESLNRYGAAGILIHHTSKNSENLGVHRARGSSAISGACWGQWQLDRIPVMDKESRKMKFDPKDPRRKFSAFNRDSDGVELLVEFNPENNSWESKGEVGADEGEQQQSEAWRDRILKVMQQNAHTELSGREIVELLSASEEKFTVYKTLNRMVAKKLINCHPAPGDKRFNVYSLPGFHPQKDCEETLQTEFTPPSPPHPVPNVHYQAENLTTQGLENSGQISGQLLDNLEKDTPVQRLETLSDEDSSILVDNFSEEVGGGCKNQLADYQTDIDKAIDSIAEALDRNSSLIAVDAADALAAIGRDYKAEGRAEEWEAIRQLVKDVFTDEEWKKFLALVEEGRELEKEINSENEKPDTSNSQSPVPSFKTSLRVGDKAEIVSPIFSHLPADLKKVVVEEVRTEVGKFLVKVLTNGQKFLIGFGGLRPILL